MIKTFFSRSKAASRQELVSASQSASFSPPPDARPLAGNGVGGMLRPVQLLEPEGAAPDLSTILSGSYRRMTLPAGLTAENGAFALFSDGPGIVCLRRKDMATTAVGYAWVSRLKSLHPDARVLDVTPEEMRAVEQVGQGAQTNRRHHTSNTAQQQGYDMVSAALEVDASDIHIDINEKGVLAPQVLVRLRVNGDLVEQARYNDRASVSVYQEVVRAMFQNENTSVAGERSAGILNESAGRTYGRLTLPTRNAHVRFELDSTSTGSTTNLRILTYEDKPTLSTDLVGLGFSPAQSELLMAGFNAPSGLILCVGPTGGGKTSTVATALSMVPNAHNQARYGLEQPVEIEIAYMQQLAFEEDAFESAFKGVMRLDPDIIYAGEILNAKAAQMATQAAMTGQLVPATLHGNNAEAGLLRLTNEQGMRVPRADICAEDTLQIVEFQKLVPQLCPECKHEALPVLSGAERAAFDALGIDAAGLYVRFHGADNHCKTCKGTGIRRRTVLSEVVRPDVEFLDALLHHGVHDAMKTYFAKRKAPFTSEDTTGKSWFEHGLYKASIGAICTRDLLTQRSIQMHPVVQRAARSMLA